MASDLATVLIVCALFVIVLCFLVAALRAMLDAAREHHTHREAERERQRVLDRATRDALWRKARQSVNADPWSDAR